MDDSLNIAATGLEAAATLAAISANNIANLNTPEYQAMEVQLAELPSQEGVEVERIVINPADSSSGGSNIDPVAQAINFRHAQSLYTANAELIQASQQMFGSLINILDTEQTTPPQQGSDNVL